MLDKIRYNNSLIYWTYEAILYWFGLTNIVQDNLSYIAPIYSDEYEYDPTLHKHALLENNFVL